MRTDCRTGRPVTGAAPSPVQGPGQQADVVLSGERVLVGTEWVESGRVRLRRRVITETQTIEVVVRREELIVETMDVAATTPDGSVWHGTSFDGPAVSEPIVEPPLVLVLSREVPQVTTHVEPYELVRVHRQWQGEYAPVSAPAAREQVVVETADLPAGSVT
jgi:uncharacterized protein (TIGR02271 family)